MLKKKARDFVRSVDVFHKRVTEFGFYCPNCWKTLETFTSFSQVWSSVKRWQYTSINTSSVKLLSDVIP